MKYDIIGTQGHMTEQQVRLGDGRTVRASAVDPKTDTVARVVKDSEWVVDEVRVRIRDGADTAVGIGATEAGAVSNGIASLEEFRHAQRVLDDPRVVAARDALQDAMRRAAAEAEG